MKNPRKDRSPSFVNVNVSDITKAFPNGGTIKVSRQFIMAGKQFGVVLPYTEDMTAPAATTEGAPLVRKAAKAA